MDLHPPTGGSTPDVQQPQWPGTLYGRKERVVLEEFLSIMNKISETAAKKLQQHTAAAASSGVIQPLPLSLQPQQQSLQVPGILAGGQGQAVKQPQGTQQPFGYAPVGSLMMPVGVCSTCPRPRPRPSRLIPDNAIIVAAQWFVCGL